MPKTLPAGFEAEEEKKQTRPIELYKFWNNQGTWLWTNGDEPITYNSDVYEPAAIRRGPNEREVTLEVSKMEITIDRLNPVIADDINKVQSEPTWIEVYRVHRDMDPISVAVIFVGQLNRPVMKGVSATIECVGFEKFLMQKIPKFRYQPSCNLKLYSTKCGVNISSFVLSTTLIGLSADGFVATSNDFATFSDGYFTFGIITFDGHQRTITDHVGSTITLRFKIDGLLSTSDVMVYAGCDKSMTSCRDKFSNLNNNSLDRFLGYPFIPKDNPVTWM